MNWLYIVTMGYIVLSAFAIQPIRNGLLTHTQIRPQIEETAETYIRKQAKEQLEDGTWAGNLELPGFTLPQNIQEELTHGTQKVILDVLETEGIYKKTAEAIADLCITIIAFFLALVVILLLMFFIKRKLDLFSKKPGIHLINMVLGFVAGAAKAFIVIWIVFYMIQVTSLLPISTSFIKLIEENAVLRKLYEENRMQELIRFCMYKFYQ